LNTGTTTDNVGVDDDARTREPDLVGLTAIRGGPVAPLLAIYTAPEWRCRVPAYRDMICRANRKRTMIPAPVQNILDRLAVAWHERAIALKAVSFALVGVVNTAIDFSVFWTTANYLHWPLVLANVVAWLVAVTFSYAMNSFITFGPESGRILRWRDYASFGASGVAGMVTSTATLLALSYVIPVLLAKLASILVSFVVNFSLSHFVVFRERPPRGSSGE
jgi:putative flippase GtrA